MTTCTFADQKNFTQKAPKSKEKVIHQCLSWWTIPNVEDHKKIDFNLI